MRTYRASGGPFVERPYYSDAEIERTCDDALQASGLYPSEPAPVRIERFIEKHFHVTPSYDDLPEGVLGYSCFGATGMESMHISRALTEAGTRSADRLANTTLAHEAGHGLFHAHLFALASGGMTLFGADPDVTGSRILCRDTARHGGYDGRWWELQASKAIGPLLMPRRLATKAIEPLLSPQGMLGVLALEASRREDAVRLLSNIFDVNPAAARVRVDVIWPDNGNQLTL